MTAPASGKNDALAIVCGGGTLPFVVADAAAQRGRKVILFALRGSADPVAVARYAHHWFRIGQLGSLINIARANNCREVVWIGSLVRPRVSQLRFDFTTLLELPRILKSFRGGDNHLLSGVREIVERHGLRLVGAHEVAPEILVPEGDIGDVKPSAADLADIATGKRLLNAMSQFDVGQAVVIAGNHVLAVEAAEGTDHMLSRVAELRQAGRINSPKGTGVLVKAPKTGQDRRFDLPTIGPNTVEGVVRAGLAGIAVAAGETIIAESDRVVAAADNGNIFVTGVPAGLS